MPALGAVVKLTVTSTQFGQTIINRAFYLKASGSDGGSTEVDALAVAFAANVIQPTRQVQHQSYVWRSVEAQNIALPAEYAARTYTLAGINTDEPLPSFVCWTFYHRRPFPPLRGGYKRFGGVPKGGIVGNEIDPTYQASLDGVAAALSTPLEPVSGTQYNPVIIAGYNDAAGTYTLAWTAANWRFQRIGTQNTRKP